MSFEFLNNNTGCNLRSRLTALGNAYKKDPIRFLGYVVELEDEVQDLTAVGLDLQDQLAIEEIPDRSEDLGVVEIEELIDATGALMDQNIPVATWIETVAAATGKEIVALWVPGRPSGIKVAGTYYTEVIYLVHEKTHVAVVQASLTLEIIPVKG
jgi:hypothetical protein